MSTIAENIKKFRELKNMTRESLAAELDMSVSGYSKLERGEVDLTVNKLFRIAEVLEVDASQILNFDVSRVFNISNNQTVNGVEVNQQNVYTDLYKEKYISKLEEEIERLKLDNKKGAK